MDRGPQHRLRVSGFERMSRLYPTRFNRVRQGVLRRCVLRGCFARDFCAGARGTSALADPCADAPNQPVSPRSRLEAPT